jgi:thiamine pyrophosphokinase
MKAIVITPFLLYPIRKITSPEDADLIICADSAYLKAQKENITPHAVIGDFDHGQQNEPQGNFEKLLRFSSVKDDTDTMLCVKYALNRGADEIQIIGGIGGRLDHTFANLQTLAYIHSRGAKGRISDGDHDVFLISDSLSLCKGKYDYASIFAYDPVCKDISLKGFKYEGEGLELQSNFPLGVSNEITAEHAEIRVGEGRLLVILAKNETDS